MARVHEAGHTVVALCLGLVVERVIAKDIGQATTSVAWTNDSPAVKKAAYYLAGNAAEESMQGAPDERTGAKDDKAVAELELSTDQLGEAKRLVSCCLERNHEALKTLVARLAQLPPSIYREDLERLLDVQECVLAEDPG